MWLCGESELWDVFIMKWLLLASYSMQMLKNCLFTDLIVVLLQQVSKIIHFKTEKLYISATAWAQLSLLKDSAVSPTLSLNQGAISSLTSSVSKPITSREMKIFEQSCQTKTSGPQDLGQDQLAQTWRKTPTILLAEIKTLIASRYPELGVCMAAGNVGHIAVSTENKHFCIKVSLVHRWQRH